jgi:segregation and condensation protein A
VSVAAEALNVVSSLRRHKTMSFRSLVSDAENTLVVVARFLALLELYKDGSVRFEQVVALGELQITWTGSEAGEISVSDEFDRIAQEISADKDANQELEGGENE